MPECLTSAQAALRAWGVLAALMLLGLCTSALGGSAPNDDRADAADARGGESGRMRQRFSAEFECKGVWVDPDRQECRCRQPDRRTNRDRGLPAFMSEITVPR